MRELTDWSISSVTPTSENPLLLYQLTSQPSILKRLFDLPLQNCQESERLPVLEVLGEQSLGASFLQVISSQASALSA